MCPPFDPPQVRGSGTNLVAGHYHISVAPVMCILERDLLHLEFCNFYTRPLSVKIYQLANCHDKITTVKSHIKALGLYNFKSGFGWAYKREAYVRGVRINILKKNVTERRDKTYLRNESKLTNHYI